MLYPATCVLSQHAQQAQAIADVCRHLLALQLHTHLCGSTLSCFHSDSAAAGIALGESSGLLPTVKEVLLDLASLVYEHA